MVIGLARPSAILVACCGSAQFRFGRGRVSCRDHVLIKRVGMRELVSGCFGGEETDAFRELAYWLQGAARTWLRPDSTDVFASLPSSSFVQFCISRKSWSGHDVCRRCSLCRQMYVVLRDVFGQWSGKFANKRPMIQVETKSIVRQAAAGLSLQSSNERIILGCGMLRQCPSSTQPAASRFLHGLGIVP